MAVVSKYQIGLRFMTNRPYGPNTIKYSAVYACSMKRACFALLVRPQRFASVRRARCMMNSRVKDSTIM